MPRNSASKPPKLYGFMRGLDVSMHKGKRHRRATIAETGALRKEVENEQLLTNPRRIREMLDFFDQHDWWAEIG